MTEFIKPYEHCAECRCPKQSHTVEGCLTSSITSYPDGRIVELKCMCKDYQKVI